MHHRKQSSWWLTLWKEHFKTALHVTGSLDSPTKNTSHLSRKCFLFLRTSTFPAKPRQIVTVPFLKQLMTSKFSSWHCCGCDSIPSLHCSVSYLICLHHQQNSASLSCLQHWFHWHRYLAKGICTLHDLLAKEVEDAVLWPMCEEMEQLVGELDYLIPKNEDGSWSMKIWTRYAFAPPIIFNTWIALGCLRDGWLWVCCCLTRQFCSGEAVLLSEEEAALNQRNLYRFNQWQDHLSFSMQQWQVWRSGSLQQDWHSI